MTNARFRPTRREALAGLAAVPLAACASGSLASGCPVVPVPSLNALAAAKGRRFGSAIASTPGHRNTGSIQNRAYAAIVAAESGIVVPENEMKWQHIRPAPNRFDFARMDEIVAWAQANRLAVRGHTLLWHRPKWFPRWLNDYDFGASPAREAERLLATHICTVTDRYRGAIDSYDVVNEAVDPETGGLVRTSLSRAMGSAEAVLDLAFHAAREQLPNGELAYNDYMGWEPHHAGHRAGVLRLLEGFRRRGVPVDALGIQSHLEASGDAGSRLEPEWRAFLDAVTAMGYRLLVTEFDVKDKGLPADTAVRDAMVADYARRYFDVMLDYPQLGDVLAWGMVDRFSWLQGIAARDDRLEVRACPYDSAYRPKPLREAIAERLAAA